MQNTFLLTVGHWASLGGEVQVCHDTNFPTLRMRVGMQRGDRPWAWDEVALSTLSVTLTQASLGGFEGLATIQLRGACARVWAVANPQARPIDWPVVQPTPPPVAPLNWCVESISPNMVTATGLGGVRYTIIGPPNEGTCWLSTTAPSAHNEDACGGVPYADRHAAMKAAQQQHAEEVRKWL